MLLSVGVFLVIVFVFLQGISSISEGTRKRQRESLENAIMRSVTHCYAVEGAYPADLEYLKSRYGLIYDETLFCRLPHDRFQYPAGYHDHRKGGVKAWDFV